MVQNKQSTLCPAGVSRLQRYMYPCTGLNRFSQEDVEEEEKEKKEEKDEKEEH